MISKVKKKKRATGRNRNTYHRCSLNKYINKHANATLKVKKGSI